MKYKANSRTVFGFIASADDGAADAAVSRPAGTACQSAHGKGAQMRGTGHVIEQIGQLGEYAGVKFIDIEVLKVSHQTEDRGDPQPLVTGSRQGVALKAGDFKIGESAQGIVQPFLADAIHRGTIKNMLNAPGQAINILTFKIGKVFRSLW